MVEPPEFDSQYLGEKKKQIPSCVEAQAWGGLCRTRCQSLTGAWLCHLQPPHPRVLSPHLPLPEPPGPIDNSRIAQVKGSGHVQLKQGESPGSRPGRAPVPPDARCLPSLRPPRPPATCLRAGLFSHPSGGPRLVAPRPLPTASSAPCWPAPLRPFYQPHPGTQGLQAETCPPGPLAKRCPCGQSWDLRLVALQAAEVLCHRHDGSPGLGLAPRPLPRCALVPCRGRLWADL